ncbi:MAG: Cell division protein FtsI [Peptidoglycan synthetase] [uncultured Nocardioidaceae bacterium]|uniref:Cell division protein FtsI [Peptidoglycan synthetase] n=1 Tax=uncultured Nocardioidaceae bacterium TaxID=253824 RepID=A0A6J4MI85_9ACTN|nr:MAG: Cell division protein FtsI [Peptidoglycan synthetase] [uncultured Nocardioidaceae bacterium]
MTASRPVPRNRGVSMVRLRIGFLLVAMVVSVFAVRLFELQGLDRAQYVERAKAVGAVQEVLPAVRGAITDRNGRPLAESLDGLMVVADPTKTRGDAAAIATVLQERLGLDYIDTVTNLRWPDTRFRYLARRVPATLATEVVEELDEQGYRGIDVRRDPLRSYPAKDVGANLVGFLNDKGKAAEGIELLFDDTLAGTDGSTTYDIGGGHRIPLGDNSTVDPVDGRDLTLTIDQDVQFYAQRVLQQTVQDARAESGTAVVLDRSTGELLALADYPTYDPNRSEQRKGRLLGSWGLRGVYEPGSVEKVLTVSALLDAGVVTPTTRLTVPDRIRSSDRVIEDYFDHGTTPYTMTGVIAKSSNVGTLLAARRMPARVLHRYLTAFGLGTRTGLPDGYGESAGLLADWRDWIQIERDNIAFGQGLAVNAVQMAAAVNTIANGGEYVEPSLVRGSATPDFGPATGSDLAERRRVVSEETASQVAQMMEMVTTEGAGTAPAAAVPGYRTAGKTGTAQIVDPECGCYNGRLFTVSFAGFAPADDPRFTVYVVVHHPQGEGGGGTIAGPAFRKITSFLLQKYAVPPTGTPPADLPVVWEPSRAEVRRGVERVREPLTR